MKKMQIFEPAMCCSTGLCGVGVGKTSTACATAVSLADSGKRVLLISTDPASNLQDVFNTDLNNKGVPIKEVPGLVVANLDPIEAAAEYRASVIDLYRGLLPDTVIENMEEQLSGSCTVEIAAFNEFSNFITDEVNRLWVGAISSYPFILLKLSILYSVYNFILDFLLECCKMGSDECEILIRS